MCLPILSVMTLFVRYTCDPEGKLFNRIILFLNEALDHKNDFNFYPFFFGEKG